MEQALPRAGETRAEESVALHFTRVMNATPSRWGVLADVALAAACSGVVIVVGLLAARWVGTGATFTGVLLGLASLPMVVTILAPVLLRGSRRAVVVWLSRLPFPVQNMNSLLAGLGDKMEVYFAPTTDAFDLPPRSELQAELDAISENVVLVRREPEQRLITIHLSVIDSKRNPFRSNHERWVRFSAVVERVLLPLCERLPIESVVVAA